MKIAVSIPDDLYFWAEEYSKKYALARSHVYAKALAVLRSQSEDDFVTEQLNRFYGDNPNDLEPIKKVQLEVMEKDDKW